MEIVYFLRDYWPYISVVLVLLADVVIILIKRRPKSYDAFVSAIQEILVKVPMFVCMAETEKTFGMEKKEYVLHHLLSYIQKRLGYELNDKQLDYFYSSVSWMVEKVLAAPTKKGGFGREEDE